jgi:hypothetical protein
MHIFIALTSLSLVPSSATVPNPKFFFARSIFSTAASRGVGGPVSLMANRGVAGFGLTSSASILKETGKKMIRW